MKNIEFSNDGSIVVYVQEDENGKPLFVTSKESKCEPPYRVRFLKNE